MGIPLSDWDCPVYDIRFEEVLNRFSELCEPPKGEGYQLWETVSDGGPISPVFASLDELCTYCAANIPYFADMMMSKDEWMDILVEKSHG